MTLSGRGGWPATSRKSTRSGEYVKFGTILGGPIDSDGPPSYDHSNPAMGVEAEGRMGHRVRLHLLGAGLSVGEFHSIYLRDGWEFRDSPTEGELTIC